MEKPTEKVYKPKILPSIIEAAGLTIFGLVLGMGFFGIILVFIAVPLVALFIYLKMLNESYEVLDDGIRICSGIIAKSKGIILYKQIQDIKENQGILETILGITNLQVITMTQTPGRIMNLSTADAEELRDIILERIKKASKTERISEEQAVQEEEMPFPIHPFKMSIASIILASIILLIIFIPISALMLIISPVSVIFAIMIYLLIIGFYSLISFFSAAITATGFKYWISKEYLHLKFQFLSKTDQRMPYSKIRNITITRGLVSRIIGLANLKVETGENVPIYIKKDENQTRLDQISDLNNADSESLKNRILIAMKIKETGSKDITAAFPLSRRRIAKATAASSFYLAIILGSIIAIMLVTITVFSSFAPSSNVLGPFEVSPLIAVSIAVYLLIIAFAAVIIFIYEIAYYNNYKYEENSKLIVLNTGVITKTKLIVPYQKIEHIFVDQDIFDRVFGLWDVYLATAGTGGGQLHIDGLEKKEAEAFRNHLISMTIYMKKQDK